jgi:RNA polymerase sigma-70 factor (ECF subfamily)
VRARAISGRALSTPTSVDPADDELVRRARAGDVDAFEALYRAHVAAISALSRRMASSAEEAGEMVQDIFVRAWEQLGTFEGRSAFGTWLHRLGVNVILNRFRSSKRESDRMVADGQAAIDAHPSVGTGLDARIDLEAALRRLPAGARAVFVLYDIQGYSHEEIARMTGTAVGTTRAQLWRARRHLMRLLDA